MVKRIGAKKSMFRNRRGLATAVSVAALGVLMERGYAQSAEQESATVPATQPAAASAAATADRPSTQPSNIHDVVVVGSREKAFQQPGSAAYLDRVDIEEQSYSDINRVLRRTPGVYVREEDGYGLFPNISLRGVDTSRSAKVTVMEDGVLTAPAAYSSPEAYYTPTVTRMRAVEVLKGSSQVRYGPHTTGGVINYLSTEIPDSPTVYLKTIYGSDQEIRVHGYVGNTYETEAGRFGILLEGFVQNNDGFKTIDEAPDFRHGDDTGFYKAEPLMKLAWEPNTEVYQRLEFKIGYSRLDGNLGYLGLSEADFENDPYRIYSSARFDNIKSNHTITHLRYYVEPSEDFDFTATAYYTRFNRNWYKLNDLRAIPGVGNMDLSAALAGASNGAGLAVLKGEAAGTLRYRNNDRSYYQYGLDMVGNYRFETGDIKHELSVGVRGHYDNGSRDQQDELFVQDDTGAIISRSYGAPGAAGDREEDSTAFAVYVQDVMKYGKLTVTPGIRVEHVYQSYEDYLTGESGDDSFFLVSGGAGATYDLTDSWSVFGGVYRGVSSPNPLASAQDGVKPETSIGTDFGVRYRSPSRALRAELVGFYTYFDNLLVIDNLGSTGTGDNENVGEVESYGVELAVQYDLGIARGWGFSNPYFLSFTYTNATLANDSNSSDPESIFAGGEEGNHVPYIPEFVITAGVGLDFEKFGIAVSGSYVDETYTSASNTSEQINAVGNPDARFGKTDSYFLLDVSAYYMINENAKLLGGVQNAFDDEYIASRHPAGPRPGRPLFAYVGLELKW